MKSIYLYKLLLFFLFVNLISCSKTEENIPIITIDELILTSDSADNVLLINELVTFTVLGDDGVDYSDQATYYVDQVEILGPSYVFDSEGFFSVCSNFNNITSNVLDFNVINAVERVLLIDIQKALRNQEITFSLIDPEGNDVTSTALFYVNSNLIDGNTFSSVTEGDFEVYAEFEIAGDLQTSEVNNFEVFIPKRKVVIEDYTGTWCGFCPRVLAAIDNVHAITNDIAIVAIHETANSNPDPMHFPQVEFLKEAFNVDGLPAARINRTTSWGLPYNTGEVTNIAGTQTNLSIATKSQLTGNNLIVDVKVIFEEASIPGDKLIVYLVEDGILYDQTNYLDTDPTSPYYQMGNPMIDFEHNDVLRMSLTQVLGDEISSTSALDTYIKSFNITIDSEYNKDNLGLVVMLVSEDNTARNAQFSDVNEDKEYE